MSEKVNNIVNEIKNRHNNLLYENKLDTSKLNNAKWISVKERLPEKDELVKSLSIDVQVARNQTIGHGCYDFKLKIWFYRLITNEVCEDNDVTHWQPLPEPPKDGE